MNKDEPETRVYTPQQIQEVADKYAQHLKPEHLIIAVYRVGAMIGQLLQQIEMNTRPNDH